MRPIFSTSATSKILEKRFTQDLIDFYASTWSGSKFQAGFLPGLLTQVNLLRLAQLYKEHIQNGVPVKERTVPFMIFIDFSQTYNSIYLNRIFTMMIKDGYPDGDIKFMKWMYSHQIVKTENSEFRPSIGVPQGGINSPMLFNITLFYMMQEFRERIK